MLASNSENPTTVGLESIISTAQLSGRRSRTPNHVAENDALIALAEKMATSPNDILQKLAETALELCHAQTCGISLLESDGVRFSRLPWQAFGPLMWGAACRATFSPCGTVLDRNAARIHVPPRAALRVFRGGHPVD